jgi:hypothetical protein
LICPLAGPSGEILRIPSERPPALTPPAPLATLLITAAPVDTGCSAAAVRDGRITARDGRTTAPDALDYRNRARLQRRHR